MKRFVKVVKDVAAETEPPLGVAVQTRNIMAGVDPPKLSAFAWLRDFHLEGAEADQKIFSRRFSGQVWLARFVNGLRIQARTDADRLRTRTCSRDISQRLGFTGEIKTGIGRVFWRALRTEQLGETSFCDGPLGECSRCLECGCWRL